MIVDWVHSMPTPPKEIRLVHGEEKARETLGRLLLK
ncbi:MBL fold metallo-hydrolase RNA specificity domain-containing protein [Desulfogranum marinum]